jgi:heme/copper-type cytochrome/quinol oxidase subunit 2
MMATIAISCMIIWIVVTFILIFTESYNSNDSEEGDEFMEITMLAATWPFALLLTIVALPFWSVFTLGKILKSSKDKS